MTITIHTDVYQNTPEWYALRCGVLTASEMHKIITPKTMQYAANATSRDHLYNLMAQRITKHVEPSYQSFDMMRGNADEIDARSLYCANYADVTEVGFITNDRWGITLGFSPDGLVGDDGLIEVKSRAPKFQLRTIFDDVVPDEFMIQLQMGLLVSERKWVDFISYCGGLPMYTKRVYPDADMHAALSAAAAKFYDEMDERIIKFAALIDDKSQRLIATERKEYGDLA